MTLDSTQKASLRRTLTDALIRILPADTSPLEVLYPIARRMAAARHLPVDHIPTTAVDITDLDSTLSAVDWLTVDGTLLGDLYTTLLATRHAQGSYFTPRPLADQVVAWTLVNSSAPVKVCDPS